MRKPKEHKSFEDQVIELQRKGLKITDPEQAARFLSQVNYYHLRGYYIDLVPPGEGMFPPGITLEEVISRFEWDCSIKDSLWPYLRRIELRLRTTISYTISERYGRLGYLDQKIYKNQDHVKSQIDQFNIAIQQSKEPFIRHHIVEYDGQFPVWVLVEILSFGQLSKMYRNLNTDAQKTISRRLDYPAHRLLDNVLRAITVLRNLCAHHARLYGRKISATCPVLKTDHLILKSFDQDAQINTSSIFSCIISIIHLLPREQRMACIHDLAMRVSENEDRAVLGLGFPYAWKPMLEELATQ